MTEGRLVCYCFGYSREDIEKEYLVTGRSAILVKILSSKNAGTCECAAKNPSGT
ncbi:hypothetical protein [Aminivibrio sp.]|uniref:hypothetical protein n=1 Tax=Aminivibrio sp. TaxID=1872489 RepID=UPI001A42D28C|nr:hypothetical protein [Aminivibrio sp.]MBL3540549.1 hypothetical protein [Aminivibrio sp.]MDK2959250.1 hypothetical protein [Synergistaceae bacterium]